MAAILRLLREKHSPPADPTTPFTGQTILLTGGTAGLGLEAAVKFLTLGASTLIIGARTPAKAARAKASIEGRAHRPGAVQIWALDMASFDSVAAFADRASRELPRVDVALLNAGVISRAYGATGDGWEETLQVDALATLLLALLLLPKLRASGTETRPAHLAITSSSRHKEVKPEDVDVRGPMLEHLNARESFGRDRQYQTSKLLVEWAVQRVAAMELDEGGKARVLVNSLCPGLCASDLARGFDAWYEVLAMKVAYALLARTAEQGGRSLVSGTAQGLEGHGKFWRNDLWNDGVTPLRSDKALQEKAWGEMIAVLEAKAPQIKEIMKS
ncbi:hypothetical protein MMC11_006048 [Xylographa trunciseda]|nr:hypothetical protein [Xylographa trunciseda]